MSYLELLKKIKNAEVPTLQNHQNPEKGGCVGFEGTAPGTFEKKQPDNPTTAWLARKGLSREHARRVEQMLDERSAFDDRKSCAECASYFAGRCVKRMQPVGDADDISLVLHRCAGFALDGGAA